MKRFLCTFAALVLLPTASLAGWCNAPDMDSNDMVLSLLPGHIGAGVASGKNMGPKDARGEGSVYYNRAKNKVMFCDGNNWIDLVTGAIDGAETSGSGGASKTNLDGPYNWTDGSKTFRSISNGQPSKALIQWTVRASDTETCSLETRVGSSWHRVGGAAGSTTQKEDSAGNFSTRKVSGTTAGSFEAFKRENGTYHMFLPEGAERGEGLNMREIRDLPPRFLKKVGGTWKGEFRIRGSDDCEVALAATSTNQ